MRNDLKNICCHNFKEFYPYYGIYLKQPASKQRKNNPKQYAVT